LYVVGVRVVVVVVCRCVVVGRVWWCVVVDGGVGVAVAVAAVWCVWCIVAGCCGGAVVVDTCLYFHAGVVHVVYTILQFQRNTINSTQNPNVKLKPVPCITCCCDSAVVP